MPEINLQNIGNNVTTNIELLAPYLVNGLTVTSNDPKIVPRDKNGIMQIKENLPLIVEPVVYTTSKKSILKVVDTQFNYYNFPATIDIVSQDAIITDDIFDPVFARYRPSEDRRILLESTKGEGPFNGILMDFIEEGNLQKDTNKYYISKELKDSGINLRFRIQIQHRYDSSYDTNTYGTCYFSIIKQSPTNGINRNFKGPYANVAETPTQFPETPIPVANQPNQGDNPGAPFGYIGRFQVQTLNLDITLLNSEFNTGDYFSIGAFAGQNTGEKNTGETYSFHTINANTSYWVVSDASKNVDEWNREL